MYLEQFAFIVFSIKAWHMWLFRFYPSLFGAFVNMRACRMELLWDTSLTFIEPQVHVVVLLYKTQLFEGPGWQPATLR